MTECIQWCRRLNVRGVTEGKHSALEKCNLKKAIWRENNEEIREALSSSEKVRNTRIPETEKERNYLKRMNLPDARTWFRFCCKITKHIKGNMSSMYREDMTCRYCCTGEEETQEHMETCEYTATLREGLNINNEREHIILWRKINRKLFKEYNKLG